MSCWSKEQLEQMLEDVINELDLSREATETHGPLGTPPAKLVRIVLDQKDVTIRMLRAGLVDCTHLLNCATGMITSDGKARSVEKITDDELMEIARPFAADGHWPSDWLSAMRLAISASEEKGRKQ